MTLRPMSPTLRTIHYWGVSTGKAQINVNLGDELHVPENVAEQLFAQSGQFKDGPAPPVDGPLTYTSGDELPVDPETYSMVEDAPAEEGDAKPKRSRKS